MLAGILTFILLQKGCYEVNPVMRFFYSYNPLFAELFALFMWLILYLVFFKMEVEGEGRDKIKFEKCKFYLLLILSIFFTVDFLNDLIMFFRVIF